MILLQVHRVDGRIQICQDDQLRFQQQTSWGRASGTRKYFVRHFFLFFLVLSIGDQLRLQTASRL